MRLLQTIPEEKIAIQGLSELLDWSVRQSSMSSARETCAYSSLQTDHGPCTVCTDSWTYTCGLQMLPYCLNKRQQPLMLRVFLNIQK